jgi:toxin ParE1/3/4
MDIVFLPEAREEYDRAADWYDQRLPGLGSTFEDRIGETLELIKAHPVAFSRVHEDVRSAIVPQFPYAVYYLATRDCVVVIAVFHASRDPEIWKTRGGEIRRD